MVKISAFSDEMSHDLHEQVAFLQGTGIRAMEIRFVDGQNICHHNRERIKEIASILSDNNIAVSAVGSPIGKVDVQEDQDSHLELFRHAVEVADILNTSKIRIFSFYNENGLSEEAYRDMALERIGKMIEVKGPRAVTLVHENEKGIYGHDPRTLLDLTKAFQKEDFTLAYDPGNFVWGEKESDHINNCWPILRAHVGHIHIKDWHLEEDKGAFPGSGDAQIPALLEEVKLMSYQGYLTLEPHIEEGGQFGGSTSAPLFRQAVDSLLDLCKSIGLKTDISNA